MVHMIAPERRRVWGDLRFEVWGLGFRVQGSGFRAKPYYKIRTLFATIIHPGSFEEQLQKLIP